MANRPMATRQVVVDADEMSDRTFIRHMNTRHADSLGGLPSLWVTTPEVHEAWRAYHDRLHELRIDIPHEHEEEQ